MARYYVIFLAGVACCFAANTEQHITHYDGFRVFRIIPSTDKHIQALKNIEKLIKLDVWHEPHWAGENYDVMVQPKDIKVFIEKLAEYGLHFTVLVDDVERLLTKERQHIRRRRKRSMSALHEYTTDFLSFPQIEQFLSKVKSSRTEPNVNLFSIGKSSEGRDLIVAKIYKSSRRHKPEIFIDAGIHAREWIAPATAINIIYQLAFNPSKDPTVSAVLDKFDWYIMPVANPDGYQFTFDHDRLWRKTRSYNIDSMCRGVDANRNFDYKWDPSTGGSLAPCEDVFAGTGPFSVPESRHLGHFLRSHGNTIQLYLSMHSFGQYLLYPWGYSRNETAPDERDLDLLAQVANRSMSRSYSIGRSAEVLYPAAGGSYDYAKGAAGIKYSYTMELPPRDTLTNSYLGFSLPFDEISPIARDTWNGIKAQALYLDRKQHQKDAHATATAHGGSVDFVGASRDGVRTSGDGAQPSRQALSPSRQAWAPSRQAWAPSRQALAPLRQALVPSRQAVAPSRQALAAPRQALGSSNHPSLSSGNDVVYSSHSGLNDYISALPQHMRVWFVQHINRLGSK
ncbi:carboxypeptidase B-like [Gigantopelta aegis]|uniref:carboxypeptidase B-like n=1 Tax=Gigantopelta aegis TaxID=1735272 RepID=UPI001B88E76B|nr:carboxypeptidase B-like [Gigantopelta aegis]XP_041375954.1 carboxypeptidase B-like [Gigantopelta aegis]